MGFRGIGGGFVYGEFLPNVQRTLGGWIRTTDNTANVCPISDFRLDSTGGVGFLLSSIAPGTVRLYGKSDPTHSPIDLSSTADNLTDGNWHHILALIDGTNGGTQKLYIDGQLDSTTISTGAIAWGEYLLSIGKASDGFWGAYQGEFAEIGAWNRWLTVEEIAQLGKARVPAYRVGRDELYCYAPCFGDGTLPMSSLPWGPFIDHGGVRDPLGNGAVVKSFHPPIIGPVTN